MAKTTSESTGTKTSSNGTAASSRERAKKILPSDRIRFEKQMDILKAYASASLDGAGVLNKKTAELVNMQESTVSLANAFFTDVRLLTKSDTGGFVPASEVVDYKRALEFTPETAGQRLAPLLSKTWFFLCLRPKLEFKPITEEEAVGDLAVQAGATQQHRQQLRVLLDYLAMAGLIQREGGQVKLGPRRVGDQPPPPPPPPAGQKHAPSSSVGTLPSLGEGSMEYHIDIRVTMAELAGWSPDRIAAFFAGMAQVIAAKAQYEEGAK